MGRPGLTQWSNRIRIPFKALARPSFQLALSCHNGLYQKMEDEKKPVVNTVAWLLPQPTIASQARASVSFCYSRDQVSALNDQIEPPNSHTLSGPRHSFWDHQGTQEWLQYMESYGEPPYSHF